MVSLRSHRSVPSSINLCVSILNLPQVKSRAGYLGCLASVIIRKEFPSSTDEIFAEIPEEFLNQVQEGCHVEGKSTVLLTLLIGDLG